MTKYIYHYYVTFEKSSASGIFDTTQKIDNPVNYRLFRTLLIEQINKDTGSSLTDKDIGINSLTFLHEVEE